MKMLLYRPPEKHYAYRWGVYAQLPNGKKWLIHYDNIMRGDGLKADVFREAMNSILHGMFVEVEAEWAVKIWEVKQINKVVKG